MGTDTDVDCVKGSSFMFGFADYMSSFLTWAWSGESYEETVNQV